MANTPLKFFCIILIKGFKNLFVKNLLRDYFCLSDQMIKDVHIHICMYTYILYNT